MIYALVIISVLAAPVAAFVFLAYAVIRYAPIIGRIFEESPLLMPLRAPADPSGETVRFRSTDGIELEGSYFRSRVGPRTGVVVFCHEYLGNRWSAGPYADFVRDLGFDLFAFDFRNQGASATEPGYKPLQWVSDREVMDLEGAIAYLKSRPDADPAGVGLFGISKGGCAALVAAADEPGVWGVLTDGSFPTRSMVMSYIYKWAQIYSHTTWRIVPPWVLRMLGWSGRMYSQFRRGCRFPDVERAAARLSPRPWLMIHGEKDAYVPIDIARGLFDHAGTPKEFWLVAKAKHNRCREVDPVAYRDKITEFLARYGPRRIPVEFLEPELATVDADLELVAASGSVGELVAACESIGELVASSKTADELVAASIRKPIRRNLQTRIESVEESSRDRRASAIDQHEMKSKVKQPASITSVGDSTSNLLTSSGHFPAPASV